MTASPPLHPRLAVSACVWHGNRILLARRGKEPSRGLWSLPGGHVHLGETIAEAVRRELMEETGVEADLGRPIDCVDIVRRDEAGAVAVHYVLIVFAGPWRTGEPRPGDDADAVCWADPDTLDDLPMTQGTAAVIRAVLAAR